MCLREEMEDILRSVHFLDSPVIRKVRAHSLVTKVICLFPNKDWEGWPDKLRLAPSGHSCHIHELGGHCVQQHLRKETWLTILHQILGSSVIGKNTVLLLVISPRENTLKANFCTEYGQPAQLGWTGSPPCGWRKDTCRPPQRETAWKWSKDFKGKNWENSLKGFEAQRLKLAPCEGVGWPTGAVVHLQQELNSVFF